MAVAIEPIIDRYRVFYEDGDGKGVELGEIYFFSGQWIFKSFGEEYTIDTLKLIIKEMEKLETGNN